MMMFVDDYVAVVVDVGISVGAECVDACVGGDDGDDGAGVGSCVVIFIFMLAFTMVA